MAMLNYSISIAWIISGMALLVTLVLLIIILWQDATSDSNLTYAALTLSIALWTFGTLLAKLAIATSSSESITQLGVRILMFGYACACVTVCIYTLNQTGILQQRSFVLLTVMSIIVILYQARISFSPDQVLYRLRANGGLVYYYDEYGSVIYATLLITTALIAFQARSRFKERSLQVGVIAICGTLLLELISLQMRLQTLSQTLGALASLILGYANTRTQIIQPLLGRANQLEAVRDVGLVITSRLALSDVLYSVAAQATSMLSADGAAVFLTVEDKLELAAAHNLPASFVGTRLAMGEALSGRVAVLRLPARIDNYRRDWAGLPDMPYAKESFGSVMAAPLIFGSDVVGVIFVAVGLRGRRFDREDVRLLGLLGPQAAVAITNSRLYAQQNHLTAQLESAKNQLETVLTSTENAVLALSPDLHIIFANPAAANLLHTDKAVGKSLYQWTSVYKILPDSGITAMRALLRQHHYSYEIQLDERTYIVHLGLLGQERMGGYVAVLNDVSELKELDRLKNQMIRMTSHDLKNPIAAAILHSELILEQDEFDKEELHADVRMILSQLERMQRIIRGILDLERVQSGRQQIDEVSLSLVMNMALNEFSQQARVQGVALNGMIVGPVPSVYGDAMQLTRALANLIDNAVKFTKPGGSINVTVERKGEQVLIKVSDTGVGIPAEARAHVFDRYFRASIPGLEQVSGSGIGLSLVKSVVDTHRGQIWLESVEGRGTTFFILLPIYKKPVTSPLNETMLSNSPSPSSF